MYIMNSIYSVPLFMLQKLIDIQTIKQDLSKLGIDQKTIQNLESDIFLLLSAPLPKNALEMIKLCGKVTILLETILISDSSIAINKQKITQKSLLLRAQHKKDIIAYQKQKKNWQLVKHPEGYFEYAKKCIDLYLRINEQSPKDDIIGKLRTLDKVTIRDIL